jgi:NADH:ubiquinone oxidoreductase subunit 5 (subunit L)/multisubunit Na+/H+ antiporter MnhA subunit
VGLLFKVGAAPFHMWTPDVYQGAPTPITGFMAAATKIAAFGALVRVLDVGLGVSSAETVWRPVMQAVAIITMIVGGVLALTQRDIKRMLAYSAILNAGYLLIGVTSTTAQARAAVLFYLPVYGVAIIGAFAVVTLVRDAGGEATDLSSWAGLGRRAPIPAALLAVFLLAFAGIPFTSIFIGKFAIFQAALNAGVLLPAGGRGDVLLRPAAGGPDHRPPVHRGQGGARGGRLRHRGPWCGPEPAAAPRQQLGGHPRQIETPTEASVRHSRQRGRGWRAAAYLHALGWEMASVDNG